MTRYSRRREAASLPEMNWRKIHDVVPRVTWCCSTCGSEDVLTDAWGRWNVEEQAWVLDSTMDDAHCNVCDGETKIQMKVIEA